MQCAAETDRGGAQRQRCVADRKLLESVTSERNSGNFTSWKERPASRILRRASLHLQVFGFSVVLVCMGGTAGFGASVSQCGKIFSPQNLVEQYTTLRRNTMFLANEFARQRDSMDSSLRNEIAARNPDCYFLSYVVLYDRYQCVVENIDTRPFENEYYDVLKDRSDTSITNDPRKIVIDVKYVIDLMAHSPKYSSYDYDRKNRSQFTMRFEKEALLQHACEKYLRFVGIEK
jgi:hypothetical protein